MMYEIFLIVGFLASIVGAICGIGGGVIIKPLLDASGMLNIEQIGFLSGCTVFAMSVYSVIQGKLVVIGNKRRARFAEVRESGEKLTEKIEEKDELLGVSLPIGSAIGGTLGKILFQGMASSFGSVNGVAAVQAVVFGSLTFFALLYMTNKEKIHTYQVKSSWVCMIIGLFLGILSAFLGIGGGPFNLIALHFFFSMSTRRAVKNSLYIIMFAQAANLLTVFVSGTVPNVKLLLILLMSVSGILGGIAGGFFSKKINDKAIDKLFAVLMILIIFLNVYNFFRYV
ncbi:sulfite exporter TauE/SafE family protein [Lachnospiraceae bacterium OttesenSCG-928-D06]|nr:sulfite exporter TauE/SafE family protein [Lachnospiraceae bacterium OttesenSCG-928-D06]